MKIVGRAAAEEPAADFALTPGKKKRKGCFLEKKKAKAAGSSCEVCGYTDCVCSLHRYRPQDFFEK